MDEVQGERNATEKAGPSRLQGLSELNYCDEGGEHEKRAKYMGAGLLLQCGPAEDVRDDARIELRCLRARDRVGASRSP